MTDVIDWPPFAPATPAFVRRGQSRTGPTSLTNRTQTGQTDAGYWMATLSKLPVGKFTERMGGRANSVKAMRAFLGLLAGGARHARVPVFDRANAPWPLDETGVPITSLGTFPHDDGTLFSDGTGYAQPVIDIALSAAAALRATSVSVTIRRAGDIVGGEFFSIGDRLYAIDRVLSVSGSSQTWAIWPPLRAAAAAGARLEFDRPVCRMKLPSEDKGDMALDFALYGAPDLAFVEAFE